MAYNTSMAIDWLQVRDHMNFKDREENLVQHAKQIYNATVAVNANVNVNDFQQAMEADPGESPISIFGISENSPYIDPAMKSAFTTISKAARHQPPQQ